MNMLTSEHQSKVIKFVQELLLEEPDKSAITAALIEEKIAAVVALNPRWAVGLDREAVTDELIRRFSMWIGHDLALTSEEGHVPWLNAARKRDWRYWQRYREWIERDLSPVAVEALDGTTDRILGFLEDPTREGTWDRRGLVVGHVQSGKTGNYSGLICKAADAGYKIIIVLAGLHNNLRSQTQIRLDEAFLGFETNPSATDLRLTGVGTIDPSIRPNFATNRSDKGDFNAASSRNLGISPETRPWLFVVKKNKTVLERLLRWLRNHVANTVDPENPKRKLITHLPLLLIDDEADHASVDTGEQIFDSDGVPDPDHNPTAINKQIRRILRTFTRAAYVGYTATPFANIFIHEGGKTDEEGSDLFPSSFIINLAAPSTYVGPSRVFGVLRNGEKTSGLPLTRTFSDHVDESGKGGWMPPGHKNGHRPVHLGDANIPESLVNAIDAFLISCAVRCLRKQESKHMSMLIHVTRFTSVQNEVARQVEYHVSQIRQRLYRRVDHVDIEARLKELWSSDFVPTTERMLRECPEQAIAPLPTWAEVLDAIQEVLADLEVRKVNGTAKDALDYSEQKGLRVIAVGGEKLSRGLTLEGLSVSYFLRASKMYDTLMQMGRWFGYRPGYLDLCRMYTTEELTDWFGHIADAADELREEFEIMASSGADPRSYGLKVQSHPTLMITSPLKMRQAKSMYLSFSGTVLETVAFRRDPTILARNLKVTRELLGSLGAPAEGPSILRRGGKNKWSGYLWEKVSAAEVCAFLRGYTTHSSAIKVNGMLISEFIESMLPHDELTEWTVALLGGGEGGGFTLMEGISLKNMVVRREHGSGDEDRYSIRRLLSDRDETIDLDDEAWEAALAETRKLWSLAGESARAENEPTHPSGRGVRLVRGFGTATVPAHPERGLLLLYLIDPLASTDTNLPPRAPWNPGLPLVGYGVSFPGSSSGIKVEYKANHVLWEQEYGPSE